MIRLLPVLWLFFSPALLAGKPPVPAEYVGVGSCVHCHAEQVKLWQGSHHDLAMQHAGEDTVLGDFSGVDFSYAGITSRFYKKNDLFMVRTDGPDGELRDYEIKYTFGVYPLQQYLVELEGGRLQALLITWDATQESDGGQRWFHLYPDEEITHDDELHWTRNMFNWNGMCAECHSTNLQRNYDSRKDVFNTTWSEIDVSCEACHGPASNHLAWANEQPGGENYKDDKGLQVLFDERNGVHWKLDAQTGSASRSQPRITQKEIDVCAPCHSRRSVISTDYSPGKPYLDHYMPRLLDEGMYFADGQVQDEVYVYGSFLQSKMYHKGVSCSDCHEPHSLKLKLKLKGNAVCLQCHAAGKFDTKKHHFHDSDSTGALCAECHMPPTTYMVIDPRHDHSLRIPRPGLSVSLGVPNACNQCHDDKDASWAAKQVKQWYGKTATGFQRYAEAFDAARSGKSGAGEMLVDQINELETPGIARATAMSLLQPYLDQSSFEVIRKGLKDEDAMVRKASVTALENLPQEILVQSAFPLLDDPVRVVRIEAARVLAPVPVGDLKGKQLAVYTAAANEYIASQQANADRPDAQLGLGNYYAARKEYDKARASYRKAIELETLFIPAYVNLADLYRVQQDDKAAADILLQAIRLREDASAYHALGLLKIRQQDVAQAIVMLQRAAELDTSNERYAYVYAVALNSTGEKTRAIEVLQEAYNRFPQNRDILEGLVAFHRDAGNEFAAQNYMKKLQRLNQ